MTTIHDIQFQRVYGSWLTKNKLYSMIGTNNFKRPGSKYDTLKRQIRTFDKFIHIFGDFVHYNGRFDHDIETLNDRMEKVNNECFKYIHKQHDDADKIRKASRKLKRHINRCYNKISLTYHKQTNDALLDSQRNIRNRLRHIDPRALQPTPDHAVLREFEIS